MKPAQCFFDKLPMYPQREGGVTKPETGFLQHSTELPWVTVEMVSPPHDDHPEAQYAVYEKLDDLPTLTVKVVRADTAEAFDVHFRFQNRKWRAERYSRQQSEAILASTICKMIDEVYVYDRYGGVSLANSDVDRVSRMWWSRSNTSIQRPAQVYTRVKNHKVHQIVTLSLKGRIEFIAQPLGYELDEIPSQQVKDDLRGFCTLFGERYEFALIQPSDLKLRDAILPHTVEEAIYCSFNLYLRYLPEGTVENLSLGFCG